MSSERCPHCLTVMERQKKASFPNAAEFRCPACGVRKIAYGAEPLPVGTRSGYDTLPLSTVRDRAALPGGLRPSLEL